MLLSAIVPLEETDVGKTFVTGLIVKKLREAGYNAGYYKAALSGADVTENGLFPRDADYVNRVGGIGEFRRITYDSSAKSLKNSSLILI